MDYVLPELNRKLKWEQGAQQLDDTLREMLAAGAADWASERQAVPFTAHALATMEIDPFLSMGTEL